MATGTAIGQKGNWRGRYSLTYTQEATQTKVVCHFYVEHVSGSGKLNRYHYRGTFDGTNGSTYYPTKASLGGDGNGKGETVAIGSVTKTYKKTHSAQSLSKNVKVTNTDTGSNVNKNITVPVPAQYHYTVAYNANGGTGSASATKWYGEDLTLNDGSSFSKNNYKIVGWNTKQDGTGTHYALGEILKTEQTTGSTWTLYAEWELCVKTKVNGNWVDGTVNVKVNGNWIKPDALYIKENDTWVQI